MNSLRLVRRSVVFYARSHLGTLLGAAVGAAVLVGALVVGDSVRGSLLELALLRLGKVDLAAASGDRLFRDSLAMRVQASLLPPGISRQGEPGVACVLSLPATAVNQTGEARANQVSIQGVQPKFWQLAPGETAPPAIPADGVAINEPLARHLDAKAGDEILFRVAKPSDLSRDAPLTPSEETTVPMRLKVAKILVDEEFGRFALHGGQLAPLNAFVPLSILQARIGMPGRANLLLIPETSLPTTPGAAIPAQQLGTDFTLRRAGAVLRQRFQLADAQLEWRDQPKSGALDLRSPRVFLDTAVGDAFFGPGSTNAHVMALRRSLSGLSATGVLTYFVNELRLGDHATPYSMVTAAAPPVLPRAIGDDEILISQWLADDLGAGEGDELTLRFYVVGASRKLEEGTAAFTVRGVLPMTSPALDPGLMPEFPGMTESENCRDWDTGLPIDTDAIREKDEGYWDQYRGTPKAFITLAAGQKLWSNRFGNLTAVRIQAAGAPGNATRSRQIVASRRSTLETLLIRTLDPAGFGLSLQPVRERALAASNGAQDFGQLFLGFSFFLIAAALLLMAVLFQFAMEQRAAEVGTLLALGFRPGQVRRLFLGEGAALAALGTILGIWGGTAYAKAMVNGLSSVWRDAVGGTPLGYHVSEATLATGAVAAWVVAVLTIWWALRRQAGRPARELLNEGNIAFDLDDGTRLTKSGRTRPKRRWSGVVALVAFVGALASAGSAFFAGDNAAAGAFFGAGALLLVAGLAGATAGLQRLGRSARTNRLSLGALGLRGLTRRRRRSVATMALLASGTFLIASIGVFRLEMPDDATRRDSGTGGFTLVGAATQPVLYDLTSEEARDTYALADNLWEGAGVVSFRVRDGEEASCLNLNRAQTPRVLGVNPEDLAERGAFRFAQVMKGLPRSLGWEVLDRSRCTENGVTLAPDEVPVVGDAASIQYALGNQVGGTLDYPDGRGGVLKLRIVGAVANSILQGSLVMAESEFVQRFPDEAGYRWFLMDAPPARHEELAKELTRSLSDLGFETTGAVTRLAEFNAVQNTYLGTFQVLGGLGLLLGSFGLGAVVLRNVLERRSELALMQALGFLPAALRRLVLREHLILLGGGLGIGVVAAIIAVLPTVLLTGLPVPYLSLGLTMLAVLVNGALWTWLATMAALRGNLLAALRND